MTKYIGLTLIMCLLPVASVSAQDQDIPAACADALVQTDAKGTESTQEAYLTGSTVARSLAEQAWKSAGGCDRLESFSRTVQAMMDSFSPPKDATEDLLCRYSGAFEGMTQAVASFSSKCGDVCETQGETVGAFAARVYCGISIALGRADLGYSYVRSNARLCNWDYQVGCESAFQRTLLAYESKWGARCSSYLGAQARERSRSQQCSFYKRLQWDSAGEPAAKDIVAPVPGGEEVSELFND